MPHTDSDAYFDPQHAALRRRRARRLVFGGLVLVLAGLALVGVWRMRGCESPRPAAPTVAVRRATSPLAQLVFPTGRDLLSPTRREDIFQPTASGRLASALWGTTRTGSDRRPRFHAGVDIAAARRDASGRPLDFVLAVADGEVVHVSRAPGGSSYGRYLVVRHDDPLGPVYSWYAHLGSIAGEMTPGTPVAAGDRLGRVGNSASYRIPPSRAHLHFEFDLMLNRRFARWARERGIRPDRGNYNGWNFRSVDPLDVYAARKADPAFTFAGYLRGVPTAFALAIDFKRRPDYFRIYPALWIGKPVKSGPMVLHVSEGGVILEGREATPEERARLSEAGGKALVLGVDEDVLGRNGPRIVEKHRSGWQLGPGAKRWLDIISY